MNTIPFGPRNEDPLLARAAELPKEVSPPRDLWPSIEARLDGEPRDTEPRASQWPMALAAGFVVASVSALLTWGLMRDPGPAAQGQIAGGQVAETAFMPVSYGPNSGITAKELVARDELLVQFREKFGELRPETRAAIARNLAVIQAAADEIDAALAKDPASGMLKGFLAGTYKQELQLYSTVVTAGDGLTRRT